MLMVWKTNLYLIEVSEVVSIRDRYMVEPWILKEKTVLTAHKSLNILQASPVLWCVSSWLKYICMCYLIVSMWWLSSRQRQSKWTASSPLIQHSSMLIKEARVKQCAVIQHFSSSSLHFIRQLKKIQFSLFWQNLHIAWNTKQSHLEGICCLSPSPDSVSSWIGV